MNFSQIETEILFEAIRSRGPGGQNVNKVSSAAVLYWRYDLSAGITHEEKGTIRNKLSNLINKDHELFLRSDEYRDLEKNKSRCIEKLQEHLTRALHRDKPRKKTKPTKASKRRKLDGKRIRGDIKKMRQKPGYD